MPALRIEPGSLKYDPNGLLTDFTNMAVKAKPINYLVTTTFMESAVIWKVVAQARACNTHSSHNLPILSKYFL